MARTVQSSQNIVIRPDEVIPRLRCSNVRYMVNVCYKKMHSKLICIFLTSLKYLQTLQYETMVSPSTQESFWFLSAKLLRLPCQPWHVPLVVLSRIVDRHFGNPTECYCTCWFEKSKYQGVRTATERRTVTRQVQSAKSMVLNQVPRCTTFDQCTVNK